jgi:Protein of unknown function (DUF732)
MAVGRFRPVLAAAAALLLATAVAHADALDDQFLGLLSRDGIVGAPDQMIAIAHERCDAAGLSRSNLFIPRFGPQPSPYQFEIKNIYDELEGTGLDFGQAAQFIRDAIAVYCPSQKGSP